MLNFVAGAAGHGQGVLIRAAVPLDDWQADLYCGIFSLIWYLLPIVCATSAVSW
jgi:hypothetical protein